MEPQSAEQLMWCHSPWIPQKKLASNPTAAISGKDTKACSPVEAETDIPMGLKIVTRCTQMLPHTSQLQREGARTRTMVGVFAPEDPFCVISLCTRPISCRYRGCELSRLCRVLQASISKRSTNASCWILNCKPEAANIVSGSHT